jgi:hypothetical protein
MSASDGTKSGNLSQRQRSEILNTLLQIIGAVVMVRKENVNTRRVLLDLMGGHNVEAWENLTEMLDREGRAADNLDGALEALKRLTDVLNEGVDG